ncbi:hypothetical protein CC1G_08918 [Coprinopsis cinerea okayama7|uniref:Uncharacterized protein n=1 Tax=Coprinopsis cinerea (strain Okayama-7 / 130 / ATCC MYA-4618 / FGSC 9003) TaxID=240176 RepID=A8P8B7_COPC7|nr:hypothetical protein CC1G_08918 [Coprinopsis cinerea okayama7\|eukprot:XP_001839539.2 hypothetical protein CC1G_08918 [Coprinopsis cinerea okayama7\
MNSVHKDAGAELKPAPTSRQRHTFSCAKPCDINGDFVDAGHISSPVPDPPSSAAPNFPSSNPWEPFNDRIEFDTTMYHYVQLESSRADIGSGFDLWRAHAIKHGHPDSFRWKTAQDMYDTIDEIQQGPAPWTTFKFRYTGPQPSGEKPKWMLETYELNARDILSLVEEQFSNPEFESKIDYQPYREFTADGQPVWSNLMSGTWAWKQGVRSSFSPSTVDLLSEDKANFGTMFVPIVAGSDKTTVSVATGHQEYHPVYMSVGNLHNTARRAHGSGVLPVAFLPIPKASKRQRKKPAFQRFCRQLYHKCLETVFKPLRPYMTTYYVLKCPDGHYRRAIFGLGPYIADYPEQIWLSGVVSNWCPRCTAPSGQLDDVPDSPWRSHLKTDILTRVFDPGILWDDYGIRSDYVPFTYFFPRADIHELLAPDILHQLIKGTFKDHLVTWVGEYLQRVHGTKRSEEILEDIDHRIAAVPPFAGLRRFPDGRDFNQWTGDDSKALMKVYLAAVAGYLPSKMVQCLSTFIDACYIVRRNSISAPVLERFKSLVDQFHELRKVFIEVGVRTSISLPRQHALSHYAELIPMFGCPNGLDSSITESKHIAAVKRPWRRSSRYKALHQMLSTLTRLDKLEALRQKLAAKGLLVGTTSSYIEAALANAERATGDTENEGGEDDDDGNDSNEHDGDDDDSDDETEETDGEDSGPTPGERSPDAIFSVSLSSRRQPRNLYPRNLEQLSNALQFPTFPLEFRRYLHAIDNPDAPDRRPPLAECPKFYGQIFVHHSATSTFYAPSDVSGTGGLIRERIRSTPSFHGHPRRDTVFVVTDEAASGMLGLTVARVQLFFSFTYKKREHLCALVNWFNLEQDEPDEDTGMFVVTPEMDENEEPTMQVISVDSGPVGLGFCWEMVLRAKVSTYFSPCDFTIM